MGTNRKFVPVETDKKNSTELVDLSIIIPSRNEELRLPKTLDILYDSLKLLHISYEVIVVNDGSNDHTNKVAKIPSVKTLNHSHSKGITAAFRTGARFSRGRIVMLCPADIDNFDFLKEAMQSSQEFDVISISKRHPKSIVIGYTRWRWLLSNGYQRLVNLLFGNLGICTDTHYIKFYRGRMLRPILEKIKLDGPVGETELMLRARDTGATFFELPAKIIHEKDNSKTSILMILRTIGELLMLRISGSG
jgi:glycosyltransferase involved in cell wall biosynthesis